MRAIVLVATLTGAIVANPAHAWLKEEYTSKVDGKTSVYISRTAVDEVRGPYGAVRPRIVIGCERGESRVYIDWQMMMDGYQGLSVIYRLDEEKPKTRWMSRSTDYQATGYWGASAIAFVKEMIGKKKLFARGQSYRSGAIELVFEIDALAEEVKPIAESCKWPTLQQDEAARRRAAVERQREAEKHRAWCVTWRNDPTISAETRRLSGCPEVAGNAKAEAESRARATGRCAELIRRWPQEYTPERLRDLGCR